MEQSVILVENMMKVVCLDLFGEKTCRSTWLFNSEIPAFLFGSVFARIRKKFTTHPNAFVLRSESVLTFLFWLLFYLFVRMKIGLVVVFDYSLKWS